MWCALYVRLSLGMSDSANNAVDLDGDRCSSGSSLATGSAGLIDADKLCEVYNEVESIMARSPHLMLESSISMVPFYEVVLKAAMQLNQMNQKGVLSSLISSASSSSSTSSTLSSTSLSTGASVVASLTKRIAQRAVAVCPQHGFFWDR